MKSYSLLRRIALGLTATMLLASICAVAWLYVKARWTDDALREQALLDQARVIARYIEPAADDSLELHLPAHLAEAYEGAQSAYRYAVRDVDGQYLFSSNGHVGVLPNMLRRKHRLYEYDAGHRNPRHIYGAALQTQVAGRAIYVQVEQASPNSTSLNEAVLDEFLVDGDWLEIVFLFALLGVCIWIVNRGLEPLRRISKLAESIGPANAGVRLPTENVPREILPFVQSLNAVLDRLEEGLERQREFNANAAHQLRTPLAVLMANVQSLDDPAATDRLKIDVEHMSRIVSQLLLVARLETLAIGVDEVVDLNEATADIATNLGPLAINLGKSIELERSGKPVFIRTNGFALRAALGNLIENAIKHTPTGTSVRLRVTDPPSVEVMDSGSGIPPALRSKIFERFWRGDRSEGGAGLGLAIVEKIAKALNATISVGDAPNGGARFVFAFVQVTAIEHTSDQSERTVGTKAA